MKLKNKNAAYMVALMTCAGLIGPAIAATAPNIGNVAIASIPTIEKFVDNNSSIGIIGEHWGAAAVLPTSSFLDNTSVANAIVAEGPNVLVNIGNLPNENALVNENASALRPNNTAYAIAANQDTGSSGTRTLSVGNNGNRALVLVNTGSSNRSVQALE